MEEEGNQRSEALRETEDEDSKPPNEGGGENRDGKEEKIDGQRRLSSDRRSSCAVGGSSRGESKASEFETLSSVQVSGGDFQDDFDESSHRLSEVPVEFSLQPLQSAEEVKDQVREGHEESLKCFTGRSAVVQIQHQIQVPKGPSKLEPSTTPVTQSVSSIASSTLPEPKLQQAENGNYVCRTEESSQNSPDPKLLSTVPVQKNPSDGYNWRKYGQKQVKSPEGSRSYYRCTFSDCYAKKIDCSDRFNRLIETVYRSHHNHDPPQKSTSTRENRPALSIVPVNGSNDTIYPVKHVNDPVPSTPSKEPLLGIDEMPEIKQQESSDSDQTTETSTKEEYADGSESKKRQKRNSTGELESLPKLGKKPKYVVHAAVDVGISGDGYRWRKYGQKMVKGNPHPRNYYRCTSAGCPVRKHIERAADNTNAVVITYKGRHDHDTPVPRKRHGPKSAITIATSPVSLDDLQNKIKPHTSQTQWSVDKEGELMGEALNVSGEKPSEPARTLLSVGFEIKPC